MSQNYKIVETFTCSKSGKENSNEDGIYIGKNFVAVIDGATSKEPFSLNGKTGGQLARDLIKNKLDTFSGNEDANTVVLEIQAELVAFAKKHKIPQYSASMVLYSRYYKEIWSVGDCQYYLNGDVQKNQKRIDQVFSETRSIAIYALLSEGHTENDLLENDLARKQLIPFLQLQKYLENRKIKYGHCVFNGSCDVAEFPIDMVKVTVVPDNSEIVLASDGYPILKNTLSESEKELKRILSEDPLCYKENCSTKGIKKGNVSFDDRTYVKFMVN